MGPVTSRLGMARRGDEAQAKTLKVVECVIEGVDLELAAVARAGIHPKGSMSRFAKSVGEIYASIGCPEFRRLERARQHN
jgi:hypothetical protein